MHLRPFSLYYVPCMGKTKRIETRGRKLRTEPDDLDRSQLRVPLSGEERACLEDYRQTIRERYHGAPVSLAEAIRQGLREAGVLPSGGGT